MLDTSVPVHDPNCFEGFGHDILVISPWLIDELDHLKRSEGERGEHARQASRNIHEYSIIGRGRRFHGDGLPTRSGGILRAEHEYGLPPDVEPSADNKTIFLAKRLAAMYPQQSVLVLSKDINLRIKASMYGVRSADYEGDVSAHDPYALFPGCLEIALRHRGPIDDIYKTQWVSMKRVLNASDIAVGDLIPNQCVYLTFDNKDTLAIYKKNAGFRLVLKAKANGNGNGKNKPAPKGVSPANCEQAFAYSLLLDPEIKLVALVGSAGSGKTLMSLLGAKEHLASEFERNDTGLDSSARIACNQILVFRPNVEMGQPLGFLPGTLGEKFEPWMYPILDNLELILHDPDTQSRMGKRYDPVGELLDSGMLEIGPINHVRGRSLHQKFVIIDEAQNLTRHEIRSLITRAGRGTKVVLTGDISQIDHPYLDQTSNGLSHVISQFIGQEIFGYTIMKRGEERSLLAKLASELL